MYEMLSESIYPVLFGHPMRYAQVTGSSKYPQLDGMVLFYAFRRGTVVVADIAGLPATETGIYGFHIHEGGSCTGNAQDAFADAGSHFNPTGQPHPLHAGDMPVLFGNRGAAWGAFFTERFVPEDVVGRTVIIHDMPDDFRSQPSGGSGEKIACGIII